MTKFTAAIQKPLTLGCPNFLTFSFYLEDMLVHVPDFGGLSGSEDRGGGDNSIQFTNFGRVGDKSFKE